MSQYTMSGKERPGIKLFSASPYKLKSGETQQYFWVVFNKTIIPFVLVGYWMVAQILAVNTRKKF